MSQNAKLFPITEARFLVATGAIPKDDDLDRCNCPLAGTLGHEDCGWDSGWHMPRFMVMRARRTELLRAPEPDA